MRNWITVKALFENNNNNDDLGLKIPLDTPLESSMEYFDFDLNEVVAYNEASYDGFSTIWINNTTITINVSIQDLRKIIKESNVLKNKWALLNRQS